MQFPIGGPLITSLSHMIVEICVKHLAKHIAIENAFILIFMVFFGKIGLAVICNCALIAAP